MSHTESAGKSSLKWGLFSLGLWMGEKRPKGWKVGVQEGDAGGGRKALSLSARRTPIGESVGGRGGGRDPTVWLTLGVAPQQEWPHDLWPQPGSGPG